MGFVEYIRDNYVMLYELVGLVIILRISISLSARMKRLSVWIIALIVVESVVFKLETFTQTFAKLSPARPLLTALLYSLYPVILMLLILLTETDEFNRKSLMFAIPWAVCVVLFFSSQWTHLVSWFTEDNHYQGGPLSYLPYFLFAFYVLIFLIQNIRFFRGYSRTNRAVTRYIVIGAMAGMVLYLVLGVNMDYSAIFTSAVLLYYVLVYIHMAKMDPLTSLPNRQSLYLDIKPDGRVITGVISVDMNDMREINARLGYEAGDMALVVVSRVLRHHSPKTCIVYRVGGDQFLVICRKVDESQIRASIAEMRRNLVKTSYVCSFGYAMCDGGMSVEEAINIADERMKADKIAIKNRS
ncbi:MAG: GGDEF domain-containing protein [Spirochaetales bacterium]|nr:GGDEF domain-containing protein [Spirochaetales bacterium]